VAREAGHENKRADDKQQHRKKPIGFRPMEERLAHLETMLGKDGAGPELLEIRSTKDAVPEEPSTSKEDLIAAQFICVPRIIGHLWCGRGAAGALNGDAWISSWGLSM
jgi:hypothetical protein